MEEKANNSDPTELLKFFVSKVNDDLSIALYTLDKCKDLCYAKADIEELSQRARVATRSIFINITLIKLEFLMRLIEGIPEYYDDKATNIQELSEKVFAQSADNRKEQQKLLDVLLQQVEYLLSVLEHLQYCANIELQVADSKKEIKFQEPEIVVEGKAKAPKNAQILAAAALVFALAAALIFKRK